MRYRGEKRGLVGYVDADGASQDHRRAISGYVFMVDGGAISWSSKKQELVTLSMTEAEYVAATHAAKEAVWLRRLLTDLFNSIHTPTLPYSVTVNLPLLSLTMVTIMLGRNILILGIISFVTSSKQELLNLSIVLLTT